MTTSTILIVFRFCKVYKLGLTAGGVFDKIPDRSPEQGEIAQLVERRTHKPKVKGSIPFLATITQAAVKGRRSPMLVESLP